MLAIAKELWKISLDSSKEKTGSEADAVQLMVTVSPEIGFVGIFRVRPATKGATRARRLSLQNISSRQGN